MSFHNNNDSGGDHSPRLRPYPHQVGGHGQMAMTTSGHLLKPLLKKEHAFYQYIHSDALPSHLRWIRTATPHFYGEADLTIPSSPRFRTPSPPPKQQHQQQQPRQTPANPTTRVSTSTAATPTPTACSIAATTTTTNTTSCSTTICASAQPTQPTSQSVPPQQTLPQSPSARSPPLDTSVVNPPETSSGSPSFPPDLPPLTIAATANRDEHSGDKNNYDDDNNNSTPKLTSATAISNAPNPASPFDPDAVASALEKVAAADLQPRWRSVPNHPNGPAKEPLYNISPWAAAMRLRRPNPPTPPSPPTTPDMSFSPPSLNIPFPPQSVPDANINNADGDRSKNDNICVDVNVSATLSETTTMPPISKKNETKQGDDVGGSEINGESLKTAQSSAPSQEQAPTAVTEPPQATSAETATAIPSVTAAATATAAASEAAAAKASAGSAGKTPSRKTRLRSIALEDVNSVFRVPCVMDCKIGTRHYDDDASAEKRRRHIAKAKATTSAKCGVRYTGMQSFKRSTALGRYGVFETTDKYHGRTLREDDLVPEATWFFHDNFRVRTDCVAMILKRLIQLRVQLLEQNHFYFYSSSLLLVYEGELPDVVPARVDVRMIDFAHTVLSKGQRDDGYLKGITYMITVLTDILQQARQRETRLPSRAITAWQQHQQHERKIENGKDISNVDERIAHVAEKQTTVNGELSTNGEVQNGDNGHKPDGKAENEEDDDDLTKSTSIRDYETSNGHDDDAVKDGGTTEGSPTQEHNGSVQTKQIGA